MLDEWRSDGGNRSGVSRPWRGNRSSAETVEKERRVEGGEVEIIIKVKGLLTMRHK